MPNCCVTVSMWGSEGGWGVSQSVSPDGDGECSDRGRCSQSFMAYLRGVAVTLDLSAWHEHLGEQSLSHLTATNTWWPSLKQTPMSVQRKISMGEGDTFRSFAFSSTGDWIKWNSKFVGLCMCHGWE